MAELDTITIKGFKSITSVEKLKLGAINVVIGPNGSGKSNFIGAFQFLKAISIGALQAYVGKRGIESVLHFGPKVTEALTLEISFQGTTQSTYFLRLEPGMQTLLLPVEETVKDLTTGKVRRLERSGNETGIALEIFHPAGVGATSRVVEQLAGWQICHFHDTSEFAKMRLPCAVDDNRRLRADGGNLPAFLYLLKERHSASYSLIRRTVQRVAPFFDDFLLSPLALNPSQIKLEWKHRDQDQYFDAWALSDGTLRFIALATLFLQPKELKPSLVLVDEPELGLHPFAISLLGALVKSASVEMQVILATQSPLLLDEFSPEDVLVAEREGHATTFRRLDAESLGTWLEDYSLGELWEKNHLGGRPKAWLA